MKSVTILLIIGALIVLSGCSWMHSTPQFEMEKLSDDVLENKTGRGISITILPIEESKK